MQHDRRTLDFYAKEAAAYGARSDNIRVSNNLGAFINALANQATVLDLRCGTGRDTRALMDADFGVTAIPQRKSCRTTDTV